MGWVRVKTPRMNIECQQIITHGNFPRTATHARLQGFKVGRFMG
jgi:hypothetical protein